MNDLGGNDIDNTLSDILLAIGNGEDSKPVSEESTENFREPLSDKGKNNLSDIMNMLEMASDIFVGNDTDTKNKLTLISALTPFIDEKRRDKLDMAKKVVKISGLAKKFFTSPHS